VWGCWLVARTDTKSAKRGKVQQKEKKSKATLLYEKMKQKKKGMKTDS
jgi:hypothetical protein